MSLKILFKYIIVFILSICNFFMIDRVNIIFNIIFMFISYLFIIKMYSKRDSLFLMLFSFIFMFCQIVGYNCYNYDSARLNYVSTYLNIFSLMPIVFLISGLFLKIKVSMNKNDNDNKIIKFLFESKYSIFILTGMIFLAWLPILIAFYPGNFSYDAGTQLRMINYNVVTKYHPVIHTFFLYLTIVCGNKIFLSYEIGLLIHSISQMLIMAFIFAYTLIYLHKNNFSYKINILFLLMYMFLPIHSIFAITTTKDIIFSGLFNLVIIKLLDLFSNPEGFFKKKINVILFIVIFVLLLVFRNNMIYAYILWLPFIFIILRKYLKKVMFLFVTILLVFGIYNFTLTTIFRIPNGPRVETFSFMVQQLARVYNNENISDIEKESIEKLYNNNSLNNYNSHISDPVKSEFNSIEFMAQSSKYISLYLNLGLKYPFTYIDSIFDNIYSFFYIRDRLPDPYSKTYIEITCLDLSNDTYDRTNNCDKGIGPIYDIYYDLVNNASYQKLPILNIFMNMAIYLMITLFVFFNILSKKKYRLLGPILLLIFYLITNLLAPVAIVRYMYPLFTCMPLIIFMFFKSFQLRKFE